MAEDCFDSKISKSAERWKAGNQGKKARQRIDSAISKALDDVKDDFNFLECYVETVSKEISPFEKLSETELEGQKPKIQSKLIADNLMFSSSISQVIEKYTRRVEYHLGPIRRWAREELIGVQSRVLIDIQKIIEKYLKIIRKIAEEIGVTGFSIGVSVGPVSFSFAFKV